MIKNARAALVASLFLGGCFVDDPAMFELCKDDLDCSGTVVLSQCRTITASYFEGDVTESFCSEPCTDVCASISNNGQVAYCAGVSAAGEITTGPQVSALCLERCSVPGSTAGCTNGFFCADRKYIDVPDGVYVCIPTPPVSVPSVIPYDYCEASSECSDQAPICADVIATWDDDKLDYADSMCTRGCNTDADCPDVQFGNSVPYQGTCVAAGVLAETAVCAQGCVNDSDCADGFDCADDKEVFGIDFDYPVCVPH